MKLYYEKYAIAEMKASLLALNSAQEFFKSLHTIIFPQFQF